GGCGGVLVSLGLRGCHVSSAGLAWLAAAAPRLERLDVAGVADVDDVALAALPSLRELDLSCCMSITDSGVRALTQGSPGLRRVSLHATAVTDAAARWLARHCRELRDVNLSLTQVSGRAVRSLLAAPALVTCNLRCAAREFGDGCPLPELRRQLAARGGRVLGLER
ncbi:unnamed protein product, partial [Phaeothamnion confervicola]